MIEDCFALKLTVTESCETQVIITDERTNLKHCGMGDKEKLSKCYKARKVEITGVSTVVNPAGLTE